MQLCEAFHMQLIDDGLVPWGPWRAVIAPGKGRIDDHGQGGIGRAVPLVEGQVRVRIAYTIAKESSAHRTSQPMDLAYGSSSTL